ncbi:hypothetical protein RAZWK3B_03330 [Roseobacter sp. AzwK-3b]|nr:hypothetical protein RAZWK3B_03330 [Roseobacter sp. AzwK-3b]
MTMFGMVFAHRITKLSFDGLNTFKDLKNNR